MATEPVLNLDQSGNFGLLGFKITRNNINSVSARPEYRNLSVKVTTHVLSRSSEVDKAWNFTCMA
jgi:hypothetical protein